MKVKVQVRGTVSYMGELKMTKAQYEDWCSKINNARGTAQDSVAHDLIEKLGLDLADPTDWSDLEVDTFEALA